MNCFEASSFCSLTQCHKEQDVTFFILILLESCNFFIVDFFLSLYARVLSHFSRVRLFATLWNVTCQALLSMGFSRQEYWSGLPFPPPGDLPDLGIEPMSLISPALAGGFFTTSTTWDLLESLCSLEYFCHLICEFPGMFFFLSRRRGNNNKKKDQGREDAAELFKRINVLKIFI